MPEPDGKADSGDSRGASGHSEEQRKEYGLKLENWLLFQHGVTMRIDTKGNYPGMDSLDAVANGVEELTRRGEPLPRQVAFKDLKPGAMAGYDFIADEVHINADFRMSRIAELSEQGWMVTSDGVLKSQAMIHEVCHQVHLSALQAELGGEAAVKKIREMLGKPDILGPTDEPWAPDWRLSRTAEKGGVPLDYAAARSTAAEVSKYAAANPIEFVAETRTGLVLGKKYSDRVMQLYEDYGGPPAGKPESQLMKAG